VSQFATAGCSHITEYALKGQIGKGAYARVKLATHRKSGEPRAIKLYERYKLIDATRKQSLVREIRIMSRLDHPGIVKFYESIDTSDYVYLVMELLPGISLLRHLKDQPER
jgi:serine/threonine protein kinase